MLDIVNLIILLKKSRLIKKNFLREHSTTADADNENEKNNSNDSNKSI